ncbi:MAG: hypothetical protein RL157_532 [Bacteroidota bacterium]
MAEAVWWPWPARASGGNRVTKTSGRNSKATAVSSSKICSRFQTENVSSGLLLNPKSGAEVKYCSAPSI